MNFLTHNLLLSGGAFAAPPSKLFLGRRFLAGRLAFGLGLALLLSGPFFAHYGGQGFTRLRVALFQSDLDVRHAPLVPERACLSRRANALQPRTVIGNRPLDVKVVHITIPALFAAQVV